MNVKTITIDRVKGYDLPKAWAKEAEVRPEDEVQITIGPTRDEAARELLTENKLTKLATDSH